MAFLFSQIQAQAQLQNQNQTLQSCSLNKLHFLSFCLHGLVRENYFSFKSIIPDLAVFAFAFAFAFALEVEVVFEVEK